MGKMQNAFKITKKLNNNKYFVQIRKLSLLLYISIIYSQFFTICPVMNEFLCTKYHFFFFS